jgi:cytochrome b
MSTRNDHGTSADRAMWSAEVGAQPDSDTVKVWDPFVRVFHWSLVTMFSIAYLTSEVSETVHIWSGYGVLALVCMRILWGVVGTEHARFADFVRGPRAILAYLRDAALLRAARHIGHNPAGGAMVIALLVALLTACSTGIMMTMDRFWGQKWIEAVHEIAAHGTLVLVALHVAGVLFASLEHRENLVRSMFTGRKRK